MNDALAVAENLNLDMTARGDEAFEINTRIAEGRSRFRHRHRHLFGELSGRIDALHAAPPPPPTALTSNG